MQTPTLVRTARLFQCALALIALAYIIVYVYIALSRMAYPFALEWMEGTSLIQVDRIMSGKKLYNPPSLEFVPLIYPPLFYYLAALPASIIGVGFLPLRLVSFAASLGCFFLIYRLVARETGRRFAGVLATSLFAATFRIGGAWFDVARVDTLFLFFLLAALSLLRVETVRAYALAGVSFALAYFTKQTAYIAFAPLLVYCVALNWRRSLVLLGSTISAIGGGSLALELAHGGWYHFYTLTLPSQHGFLPPHLTAFGSVRWVVAFWKADITTPLALACFVAALYVILAHFAGAPRKAYLFYCAAAIGMLGLSWAATMNLGSYKNVLLPAYATIAIVFGLGVHQALTIANLAPTRQSARLQASLYLVCILQFVALRYPIAAQLPTPADREVGERLVNLIAETDGEIFIPYHSYLAVIAGKQTYADAVALSELRGDFGGGTTAARVVVQEELREAFQRRDFALVILARPWPEERIEDYYLREDVIFPNDSVFRSVTGSRLRPMYIFTPKGSP